MWRLSKASRINNDNNKKCQFHHRGLECHVVNHEIPGVTGKNGLGGCNGAGKRLTEFCQENILVIANTLFQQQKKWLYTWTSPNGQCQNQIDYVLCNQVWRNSINSAETKPGADCGSGHKLLIAIFRLKLNKVGEMRPGMTYIKPLMIIQWRWQIDSRD